MSPWHRFGRLPPVLVVGATLALAALLALALDEPARTVGGVVLLAVLAAYCAARPSGGVDVFLLACTPAGVSAVAGDLAGVPRWWIAVPLSFVVLAALSARRD